MKIRPSDLWRWEGTVGRGTYALAGLLGFALKHNLDRFVVAPLFYREWDLTNYWVSPVDFLRLGSLPREDGVFFAAMLLVAIPFIRLGISLTLRRLRSAGLPGWLTLVFFLPFINLLFFLILSILPSRESAAPSGLATRGRVRALFDRLIPDHSVGSAALAILVTSLLGLGATLLCAEFLTRYGWGLFVALPFCLGLFSTLLYGYHQPRSFSKCAGVACLSILLVAAFLVAMAVEGVICLAMAVPFAIPLAFIGGWVGYLIQRAPTAMRQAPTLMLLIALFPPGLGHGERAAAPQAPLLRVSTAIEINAPSERVWKHVVSFSTIEEPKEWLFKTGVACPTRATIDGRGPGAIRHCVFSTGEFVEPIEVWSEPRLLRFSVISNPAPMREWSPYANVRAPHLKGFFVSSQGEFLLIPLAANRTLLQGTTWYRHNMWPVGYWQLWSDFIIHRIHSRVLGHIKLEAENKPSGEKR